LIGEIMRKSYSVKKEPALPPVHPGAVLREEVLPALGFSLSEVARRIGVSRQTLHRILAEVHAVTPEMALRLGKFLGNGPGLWLTMQQDYDLWRAREGLAEKLAAIESVRLAA
jgi:antitoxin HigA-1